MTVSTPWPMRRRRSIQRDSCVHSPGGSTHCARNMLEAKDLGTGRYRTRTCDLLRVEQALWPTELIALETQQYNSRPVLGKWPTNFRLAILGFRLHGCLRWRTLMPHAASPPTPPLAMAPLRSPNGRENLSVTRTVPDSHARSRHAQLAAYGEDAHGADAGAREQDA